MTRPRAIAIAIACIEHEIKRLAVEANLHEVYGLTSPGAIKASQRRAQLRTAIETLQQPEQTRMKL